MRRTMAERLEELVPADGLAALVRRLEQLRDLKRTVRDEKIHYSTDADGVVDEFQVMHTYKRRG